MFHLQIRKQLKGTSRFCKGMCDRQEWFQISKQAQKSSNWLTSKASYRDRLNLRYVVLLNLFQLLFSMQEPNMLMSYDLWVPYINDVRQRGGGGLVNVWSKQGISILWILTIGGGGPKSRKFCWRHLCTPPCNNKSTHFNQLVLAH